MAARPGGALAFPSSPTSLLLSRSRSAPDLAAAPTRPGRRRRWLVAGVPAVAGVLAASAPASAAVLRDGGATLLVTAGAYSLVRAFDALTERRLIEQNLSRKIVHVLSGVLFMSSWPLFSDSTEARFFAAVVPFLNCVRLLTYGLGFFSDEALVKSVTREGKREELLRGPLYYVIVLLIIVLVFWRDSPIGIVSLSMMSGGDGFADIIGRRFGSLKLPFNKKKSWAGSVAMFISGSLLSAIMLFYFSWLGHIQVSWDQALGKLLLVALAATVVECIPVNDVVDDNISVPLATMCVAFLLFGSTAT
ncbi:probable phytol kinase, chloroplastic [Lolium perenne]|uniref:probable phytol kinase, chloroplastic n=1 Tax=Lolium perenne TaxID=4522 RepID=UPI0021F6713A|nr:probable phytol kinase, chloroplastic [Lolium perenne]